MMDEQKVFNIGRRNYLSMRKILWKAGVMIHAEDVGGMASRTVRLDIASGRVLLRGAGNPEQDLVPAVLQGKEHQNGVQRFDRG